MPPKSLFPGAKKFRHRGTGTFNISSNGFGTFDRNIVKKNWKAINEGPLKRAGLLARKIMIRSIRKDRTKKQLPSKVGKPPKSRHVGHPFRLIFSLPKGTSAVVVGHMAFRSQDQTTMSVNEFGENVSRQIIKPRAKGFSKKGRKLSKKQIRAAKRKFKAGQIKHKKPDRITKTVRYPKRPFARPALEKTKDKLPALWANSVKHSTVSR